MAITYPLSLPASIGLDTIKIKARNVVKISQSPFTFSSQIVKHPGKAWAASIAIPPCRREYAEPWIGFLLSLEGQSGTFLLGDPNCVTPRGAAATTPGTPRVNGASQTGTTLNMDGAPASVSNYLRVGDYFQLGSGATSRFYKITKDVSSNGSGQVVLDFWPSIITAPADNAVITLTNCVGLFRLSSNTVEWDIDNASKYGVYFDCEETL